MPDEHVRYDVMIPLGYHSTYVVRSPNLDERLSGGLVAVATCIGQHRIAQCAMAPERLGDFARAVDAGGVVLYYGRAAGEDGIRAALVLVVSARLLLGGATRQQLVDANEPWRGMETIEIGEDDSAALLLGYCTGEYAGALGPEVYIAHAERIMNGGAHDAISGTVDDFLAGL